MESFPQKRTCLYFLFICHTQVISQSPIYHPILIPLRQENPCLTTTTTQLGRGLCDGGCTEIQGWWKQTGCWCVYREIGVAEINGETGCIYVRYPRIDRLSSHHVPHHLISFYNELHSLSFPSCDLTHSFRHSVKPYSRVVSCLRTQFQPSSTQTCCFFQNPSGCHERCGGVLTMASMSSNSTISLQMETRPGFWFGKLSMELWQSPVLLNSGQCRERQVMKDTYAASRVQCQRK